MNIHNYRITAIGRTFSASENILMQGERAATGLLHITSLSGAGAGIFEGTFGDVNTLGEAGVDWFPLPSLTISTAAVTKNLPGATLTPNDDDVLAAALQGSRWWRFRRTANSGVADVALTSHSLSDIATSAGASGAVTIADGADVTQGAIADSAATAGGTGTLSAKLRRISADIATIMASMSVLDDWDNADRANVILPAGTSFYLVCDGTDEVLVSASARRLLYLDVFSLNDLPVYAKAYDKATAASESDTPIFGAFAPSNSTAANGAGSNKPIPPGGIALAAGLSIRVVKGLADSNDTAVDASEVIVCAVYSTLA